MLYILPLDREFYDGENAFFFTPKLVIEREKSGKNDTH